MIDEHWHSHTVAVGCWKYDGLADKPVRVVGLPYDYYFSLAEQDEMLEPGEEPEALGPDGLLYYVVFASLSSPGFPTIAQAKAYARSKVQSEITWD